MSKAVVDVPPKGGYVEGMKCFRRKDGVILGADTRATEGPIVCGKNCEKIHYMAHNIYCCGAGTAADTEAVTVTYCVLCDDMVSSQLQLHRCHTGLESKGCDCSYPSEDSSFKIYPHGSTDTLPFARMGSGCLAAMAVFESKYREGLTREEGINLVSEAICSGISNNFVSGSTVDVCVITKGHKEYLRNHQLPNPRTYMSSKGYYFLKPIEFLMTKVTPLKERVELIEVGDAMEE